MRWHTAYTQTQTLIHNLKIQTNKLSVWTGNRKHCTLHTHTHSATHCAAGMIHIDCDNSEINSNADPRLGVNPNRRSCQPCDADAIDGEDSPLQSKRSSRFRNYSYMKSHVLLFSFRSLLSILKTNKQNVMHAHQIYIYIPFCLISFFICMSLFSCCCFLSIFSSFVADNTYSHRMPTVENEIILFKFICDCLFHFISIIWWNVKASNCVLWYISTHLHTIYDSEWCKKTLPFIHISQITTAIGVSCRLFHIYT